MCKWTTCSNKWSHITDRFAYADNSTMTCEVCHEECNDTCSGPVSSLLNNVALACVIYYRHLVTVLVDVRTFLFPLPATLSLVFHSVH